jgi:hypothetical protein
VLGKWMLLALTAASIYSELMVSQTYSEYFTCILSCDPQPVR